jgi:D-alanyl-lipoteichoic acid acyltransferase DltB (MBOAT superfamily)
MAFNTLPFFFFLPAAYLAFFLTSERWRWLCLLLASYLFYSSFDAPYLPAALAGVTGASYLCGLRIASARGEPARKLWLWTGCAACLSILALLKYLPFLDSPVFSGVKVLGASFYAFQAVSYLADVYLETAEPERHLGRYALFLAFFPKLLQGPIERASDLLPQIRGPLEADSAAIRSGLLLFAWGFLKKTLAADRLALYCDQVFGHPGAYAGLPLWIGVYAFSFQIYLDFSAYTDMARGIGRTFGIRLSRNFESPYLAVSIADFWRRWHISFSRWILDYIFKPLQYGWRDRGNAGTAVALAVTFLASGLWHGAARTYVLWGLLHGAYLAFSVYWRPIQQRMHERLGWAKSPWLRRWKVLATFHLVCLAWVFFRAATPGDAFGILKNLFDFRSNAADVLASGPGAFIRSGVLLGLGKGSFIATALLLPVVASLETQGVKSFAASRLAHRWWALPCAALLMALAALSSQGPGRASPFVYSLF